MGRIKFRSRRFKTSKKPIVDSEHTIPGRIIDVKHFRLFLNIPTCNFIPHQILVIFIFIFPHQSSFPLYATFWEIVLIYFHGVCFYAKHHWLRFQWLNPHVTYQMISAYYLIQRMSRIIDHSSNIHAIVKKVGTLFRGFLSVLIGNDGFHQIFYSKTFFFLLIETCFSTFLLGETPSYPIWIDLCSVLHSLKHSSSLPRTVKPWR